MKTRTRVQQSATMAALALALLVVAAVAVQIFLAGLALFDRATWWADHKTFGMMIGPAVILLTLAVLIARPSRRLVAMSLALLVLYIVQINLPDASPRWVAALHPLVGGSLMALPMSLAQGLRRVARTRPAEAAEAGSIPPRRVAPVAGER